MDSEHEYMYDEDPVYDNKEISYNLIKAQEAYVKSVAQIEITTAEKIQFLESMRNRFQDAIRKHKIDSQYPDPVQEKINEQVQKFEKQKDAEIDSAKNILTMSQKTAFKQVAIDHVMEKLEKPSREMELGMAITIILHVAKKGHIGQSTNATKLSDDDSDTFLRSVITKLLEKSGTSTPQLFEEYIIQKAREILFDRLAQDIIKPVKEILIVPKSQQSIKLTDTSIHHSHTIIIEKELTNPQPKTTYEALDFSDWNDDDNIEYYTEGNV